MLSKNISENRKSILFNKNKSIPELSKNEALNKLKNELSKKEKINPIGEIMKNLYEEQTLKDAQDEKPKENEKLITFGQLLTIKREKMGLNVTEVRRRMKMSSAYTHYENDRNYPHPKNLQLLISFYGITNDELNSCKYSENKKYTPKVKNKKIESFGVYEKGCTVQATINSLEKLTADVNKMTEAGILAKTLKKDSQDHLAKIIDLLTDILILDKIL